MQEVEDRNWRLESGVLQSRQRTTSTETAERIWGSNTFRVFLSHKDEVKEEAALLKERLAPSGGHRGGHRGVRGAVRGAEFLSHRRMGAVTGPRGAPPALAPIPRHSPSSAFDFDGILRGAQLAIDSMPFDCYIFCRAK